MALHSSCGRITPPGEKGGLSRRYERLPDALSLAFVAFNAPHFADFVIEDETPILQDDQELTRVHHYSRILSLPAKNRIFAIEG